MRGRLRNDPFGVDLAQSLLKILNEGREGSGQTLAPADHHIIAIRPCANRHNQFGDGPQAAPHPIANHGVPDLAADGEADAQSLRAASCVAPGIGGGTLRVRLQDQAWGHPLSPLGRDKQEFPPPLEAGEDAHA